MHRNPRRRWISLGAALAMLASCNAPAGSMYKIPPDRNLPVGAAAAPLTWKEQARPPLDPDPTMDTYSFLGADYDEDPPNPYVYLLGRDVGKDVASATRTPTGDGLPDTWLRLNARSLGFYMGRGGGYYIKDFVLQTKGYPFRRWDTVANSRYPLLQVFVNGRRINSATGSIAGFNPPKNQVIDLLIADDGLIATRHTPMELIIVSLDAEYRMDVNLINSNDYKID